MARDHARIRTAIWADEDFKALRSSEQRLFFLALSQPLVTQAGVVPYQPRRWATLAADTSQDDIAADTAALTAARFVIVDEDTEEFMFRTFVRHDGVMAIPNVARAMVKAYRTVLSPLLRVSFLHELRALREADPGLKGWDVPECIELSLEPFPEGPPNPSRTVPGTVSDGGLAPTPLSLDLPLPPTPSPSTSAVEPSARPDVDRICTHLADRIEANGSKRPTVGERWRTAGRLLMDADHRTEQQVHAAIDWCQSDEFWRANVLSMSTLREKYDQLRLVAEQRRGGQPASVVDAMEPARKRALAAMGEPA